jgi:TonB family protein
VKPFTPLAETSAPAPAAPLPEAPQVAQLAIVGLDPSRNLDIPAPPPPHPGAFSAGPKPLPKGTDAAGTAAAVTIPGLTVRGGIRDRRPAMVPKLGPPSMQNLLAGIRALPSPAPGAAHLPPAPDPSLEGRIVFTLAIQMPNVTSYSGSWIVWFAEREPSGGRSADVRPPVPLRKVDPKYIASAAAEGVEGVVRLAAVIRKTGHVDSVKLLRRLDSRLDASAMEALAKWEFEPAQRNGISVDVDAVFEIPFRLAPKTLK